MTLRRNLHEWLEEFGRHPLLGLAGFAVGLLFSVGAMLLEIVATHRNSAMIANNGTENLPTFLIGVFGAAVVLWLIVRIPARKRSGAVFVLSLVVGAIAGLLVQVIATTLAR
jgi:uncharacterized membrane protein YeaQ/YmgE (transglycosylase-associated protein family)